MILLLSFVTALVFDASQDEQQVGLYGMGGGGLQGASLECQWFGTAPFCEGECPVDWTNTQQRKYANVNEAPSGLKDSFGAECWSGQKVWCCKDRFWEIHRPEGDNDVPCLLSRRSKDGVCGEIDGLYYRCDDSVEARFHYCNVETQKCVAEKPIYASRHFDEFVYDSDKGWGLCANWKNWKEGGVLHSVKYGSLPHKDNTCYALGRNTQDRDGFCAGDMLCARKGFDSRDLGDCDGQHCCSKALPEWSPKCYTPGHKYFSDETCAGDMVCRQKGKDGSTVGCKNKFCCTHPEGTPQVACWWDACSGYGRRRLYGFYAGPTCTQKQAKDTIYKAGDGKCYKALTDCLGCLDRAASHPTHLEPISCPSVQCVEHAAVDFVHPTEVSTENPGVIYFFAAIGVSALFFAGYKMVARKTTAYDQIN